MESLDQQQKLIEEFFTCEFPNPKHTAKALLNLTITKSCSITHLLGIISIFSNLPHRLDRSYQLYKEIYQILRAENDASRIKDFRTCFEDLDFRKYYWQINHDTEFSDNYLCGPDTYPYYLDFFQKTDLPRFEAGVKEIFTNNAFKHLRSCFTVNWDEYAKLVTSECKKPIHNTIFEDNVDKYMDFAATNARADSLDTRIKATDHINLAARYGAVKIFKFLMNTEGLVYLDPTESIQGGNAEIVRICEQQNVKIFSDSCLQASIKYHRIDLYNWILSNRNPLSGDNEYDVFKLGIQFSNAHVAVQYLQNPYHYMAMFETHKNSYFPQRMIYSEELIRKTENYEKFLQYFQTNLSKFIWLLNCPFFIVCYIGLPKYLKNACVYQGYPISPFLPRLHQKYHFLLAGAVSDMLADNEDPKLIQELLEFKGFRFSSQTQKDSILTQCQKDQRHSKLAGIIPGLGIRNSYLLYDLFV
jgi:hypothetical protein